MRNVLGLETRLARNVSNYLITENNPETDVKGARPNNNNNNHHNNNNNTETNNSNNNDKHV